MKHEYFCHATLVGTEVAVEIAAFFCYSGIVDSPANLSRAFPFMFSDTTSCTITSRLPSFPFLSFFLFFFLFVLFLPHLYRICSLFFAASLCLAHHSRFIGWLADFRPALPPLHATSVFSLEPPLDNSAWNWRVWTIGRKINIFYPTLANWE